MISDKIKVAVLDSGLDPTSFVGKEMGFSGGLEIYLDENNNVAYRYDAVDDIGHGTAVASVINSICSDVEIIPIKIVRNGIANGTEVLVAALEYLYDSKCCNIINISAGIIACDNIGRLYSICQKLMNAGVIIVAAFDSDGAVSYPSAFDCVIGVDGSQADRNIKGYWKCGTGTSNYIKSMREKRLPWLGNTMKTVSGTSFLAPEFSAMIAKMLMKKPLSFAEVKKALDEQASGEIDELTLPEQKFDLDIKKAIVFPFNKEMHSLARYEDMLQFQIMGFYDTKYSGQVGCSVNILQKTDSKNKHTIQNIDKLDWDADFDTVILGHTSLLSNAIGRDYEAEIIHNCECYNKKLFSCRDIRDINPNIHYCSPHVDAFQNKGIKRMHVFGCPVLGVVGTGTKQGKFSLQLSLRREFIEQGYTVGQLGTEPTAQLFGMDAVYPMGHESAVDVKGFDAVFAVNQLMSHIEKKNPDIILFGSQSHTVVFVPGGPAYYPVCQQELLMGCQADAYILVVCVDNPIPYIRRNIAYLESILNAKVLALAVSPLSNNDRWSSLNNKLELISKDIQDDFCNELYNEFGIPALSLQKKAEIKKIVDLCIDYFS